MFEQTVEALKRRGFEVEAVATRQEALSLVMKEAESAASVGWGGSESVKEIGARARLVESGKEIRDHQLVCDLFLLSANALTTDGRIVNIDGTGNRVAASICGPKRVVYVIGRNNRAHQALRLPAECEAAREAHSMWARGRVCWRRGMRFARQDVQGDGSLRPQAHRHLRKDNSRG